MTIPAPGADIVLARTPFTRDTDETLADFVARGVSCINDAGCAGGTCVDCTFNACTPTAVGTACPDADRCNGAETCDGAGQCAAAGAPDCDDDNVCTVDSCDSGAGCVNTPADVGTAGADADRCNGDETCNGAGARAAGVAPDCDDANVCTADSCDAAEGCVNAAEVAGTDCGDDTLCSGDELCDGDGACLPGEAPDCADANAVDGPRATRRWAARTRRSRPALRAPRRRTGATRPATGRRVRRRPGPEL